MTEDELELWSRCRGGNEDARETLILKYLPLVDQHVKRLRRRVYWANALDLRSEGIKGLIWAIDRFDPEKGLVFEAYARNAIRGAMLRNDEVSRNLQRELYESHRKLDQAQDKLIRTLARQPTPAELAEEAGLTQEELKEALDAMMLASASSIEWADSVTADVIDEKIRPPDVTLLVHELLGKLPEEDQRILIDFYWNDCSDAEIARKRGQTEAAVKKRRQRALAKLRGLIDGK